MNGKKVTLRIFVQDKNIDKVDFAMESLKRSMKWDEDVFGLEYDLEIFNIVAVDDFNMGYVFQQTFFSFFYVEKGSSRLFATKSITHEEPPYRKQPPVQQTCNL